MPVLLMASAGGPRGLPNRCLALLIGVVCLVMGSLWSRSSWPSRIQSQGCIVVGAACIAAACVIESSTQIGLLGVNAFAVLSAFVMFFHSRRLLTVVWIVGATTVGVLALRLVFVDTALAIGTVIVVVVINVVVAAGCRMALRLSDTRVRGGGPEPLTGLLDRESFDEQLYTLIGARSRADDLYLVVLVLTLDGLSLLRGMHGEAGANRARIAVAQSLRDTVRRDTVLAHVADAEFLIAELFITADPESLAERIRGAVSTAPFRLTASIGGVSTPLRPLSGHPAPEVVEELLTIAASAMYEARKAGGNQVHLRLSPPLSVLNPPRRGPGSPR